MKKYVWIKAEDNNSIGSGKISRRAVPYKPKRKRKFKPPVVTSMFHRQKKSKTQIKFPSDVVKKVFYHWQLKGYPFTVHKEQMNKTTTTSLMRIQRELNRKGAKAFKIIEAIDKCHDLFHSDYFKYSQFFNSNKLTLSQFFYFQENHHKKLLRKLPDLPRSWYKECKKYNEDQLLDKYGVKSISKYAWANKKLIEIWMEYRGNNKISPKIRQQLGVVARKVEELAMENWRNPYITGALQRQDLPPKERWVLLIVNTIHRMLNENKTYKPKHLGWLLTEHFYNEEIPNDIIRTNLFPKDKLDWRGIEWE